MGQSTSWSQVARALDEGELSTESLREACARWLERGSGTLLDVLAETRALTEAIQGETKRLGHNGAVTTAELPNSETECDVEATCDHVTGQGAAIPLPPRDRLPRYVFEAPHKAGGLGEVQMYQDRWLGRVVARKQVRRDRLHFEDLSARLVQEARIASQLAHPNIVPVHDIGDPAAPGDAGPWYIMPFIDGETLDQAIDDHHQARETGQRPPRDLRDLLEAFVTVCRAVAYAHSRDVLHRDLKGQNIILGQFGEVILIDWGLAKVSRGEDGPIGPGPIRVDELEGPHPTTQAGAKLGTRPYLAPDIVAGRPTSRSSDIYALGVVLYRLLCGKLPYHEVRGESVLEEIAKRAPDRPRSVLPSAPPALEAICLKAMARDPKMRYATANDLADDVRRWLADEPVGPYRDPWSTRVVRWGRRNRTLVTTGTALVLTTLIGLGIGAVVIEKERRDAVKAKDEAQRALQVAERHYKMSRDLSLKVLDYAEERLSDVRQLRHLEAIRLELLNLSLGTLRALREERPDDDELSARLAVLYRHAANLRRQLGKGDEALEEYRRAISLVERLHERHPKVTLYQVTLVEALRDDAVARARRGRVSEAHVGMTRALALAEDLRTRHPDERMYDQLIAHLLVDQSAQVYQLGRFDEALAATERSIALFRQLGPDHVGRQDPVLLGMVLLRRGVIQRELGEVDKALKSLDVAVDHLQLLADTKTDDDALHFLARALTERGRAGTGIADRHASAQADLTAAIDYWELLKSRHPDVDRPHEAQGVALEALGTLHRERGELNEAEACYTRSQAVLIEKPSSDLGGSLDLIAGVGRVLEGLAQVALARGQTDRARDFFTAALEKLEAALRLAPEHALVRRDRDRIARELGPLGRPEGP